MSDSHRKADGIEAADTDTDADLTDLQRTGVPTAVVGTEDTIETTDLAQAETISQEEMGQSLRRLAGTSDDAETDARGSGRRAAGEMVRPGSSIEGRYQVHSEIARGSMARIYEGEQVSVGRRVALKIINREFAKDTQALARFQREAAVLAQIDHPNIVTVYDIGTAATGEPYLVMEFVSGRSLSDIIKEQGRVSLEHAVSLLLQVARALHTVHEAGVVHRDLKPGNLLVTTRTSGVQVAKIADFGLAKVVEDQREGEFMTRAGTILGTPEYMAPEQIKGAEVDRRADVYSLGCMAYEMLTGAPPFVGEEEMSTLYRHLHERPPPLHKACPEAGIPRPFQPLMDKALAKAPDDRFASAFDFYVALIEAADEAGMPRSRLRIVETLYEDAAYARTHESDFFRLPEGNQPAADAKRGEGKEPKVERILVAATLVVFALVAGIVIERLLEGSPSMDSPPVGVVETAPELLLISTRPEGATVALDGVTLSETTPTSIRGVAPGKHSIALSLEGYEDVERPVVVAAGGRVAIDVTMPAPSRKVVVHTVPSGAVVFLNGKPAAASTPATVRLTGGDSHELRLEKTGYEPLIEKIAPDDRESRLELVLEVEKRPIGTVWVDSRAPASVWIDGIETGFVTPTVGLRVPAGRHTVELRDATGRRSKLRRIKVARGESIHVTLDVE